MNFSFFQVRHFFLLLCQFINHLEVLWLPVYFPSEIERADPRLYARNVRKLMAVEVLFFIPIYFIHLCMFILLALFVSFIVGWFVPVRGWTARKANLSLFLKW